MAGTSRASTQKKPGRIRPPRVQIEYEVNLDGAMKKTELPFVVGILADLSAQRKEALPKLKDRKFVNIDRDNLDEMMEKAAPRLAYRVPNKLTEGNQDMNVELNFKNMDDFGPAQVAKQVPALKALLEQRDKLHQMLTKLEGNDALEDALKDIVTNTEKAIALAKETGVPASNEPAPPPAQ
jgi:type VI secretion system protein ImpB